MNFLVKIRIYLLVILYNVYFLTSLARGYTVDSIHTGQPLPITYFTVAVNPTSEQPLLLNDDNGSIFKTKLTQVKKDVVIVTAQYFNLRTYILDNNLHYNIPLICYKFAVSQHTADG